MILLRIVGALALAGMLGTASAGCRPKQGPVAPSAQPEASAPEARARPLELAIEGRYACMRRGGELWCWGKGVQLPDAETASPEGLMSMPLTGIERFAAGSDRICGVTEGQLRCLGHDGEVTPPLQREATDAPIEEVTSVLGVVDVRIHDTTVCALDRSGTLSCWTYEEPYEESDEDEQNPPWMEPYEVAGEVVAFDVGDVFACTVRVGGRLECWGADPVHVARAERAQLQCYDDLSCDGGDYDGDDGCDLGLGELECDEAYEEDLAKAWADPVVIEGVPEPVEVAAGSDFACARTKLGGVRCWGEGTRGQLGQGAARSSQAPVAVLGIEDAVAIDAGVGHACAVLADGRVACWGDDRFGAVGGTASDGGPHVVPGLTEAVDVVLAQDLSCAVLRDGSARCWGRDLQGRVRGVEPPPREIPAAKVRDVARLLPVAQDTCAGRADGSMVCWGLYDLDVLRPARVLAEPRPSPNAGLVQILATGPCARTSAEELRCWRSAAEMHQGGPTTLVVPKVVAADASKTHVCAVDRAGDVQCWAQAQGKLPAPARVGAVGPAIDVAVGVRHGCAVRRDGGVDCWLLDTTTSEPPFRLSALTDAVSITEGNGQACVRTKGGRVRCWRWDELRAASFDHPLEGVEAITGGLSHLCALAKGQVWCWGSNGLEQLGAASLGRGSAGPQRVLGLGDVVELAAGDEHTCARERGGAVRCWGRGSEGQLGRLPSGQLVEPTPLLRADELEGVRVGRGASPP